MTEPADDAEDRMVKIGKLIVDMQSIKDRFGDTCVYIRRGGLSWGAVALNRRDDDKKHGVFDLQEQHDRDMLARLEQIERLKASRNSAEQEARSLKVELASTRLRVTGLEHTLRPFADIALERDGDPASEDHISGVDLAITPQQVRAARTILDPAPALTGNQETDGAS
ncbi:hypothetical protein [Tardiphaga sp.]|jgi:hypothetical protein|uniref:hypothetical protein n=1 Tax=Tardiphaga sp. TaxID=1926292 RepID=UPI0037D9DDE1